MTNEPMLPSASREPTTRASRGQILVLFAMLLTILIGFSAVVVDVAWIWTNQLRVQRAADAAALAGVVHLPGQVSLARADALAESRKNGYRNGVEGVVVTPQQDPDNPRRMLVTVQAPVHTFFMGLFGWDEVTVTRTARADFVLPVPMGSPLNYYGVGDYRVVVPGATGSTSAFTPTALTNGSGQPNAWDQNAVSRVSSDQANPTTSQYAHDNDGDEQGYRGFSITGVPAGSTITGITVRVDVQGSDSSGCEIGVALSWNNGSSWTTQEVAPLTGSWQLRTVGGTSQTWDRSWTTTELTSLAVRVSDEDPGGQCDNGNQTRLDYLTVTIHYATEATVQTSQVTGPNGSPLCGAANCSQGFWGAIEGQGSNRSTGDAYATGYNGSPTLNDDYEPGGYDYTIEVPSGGSVYVFDPTFCAMGNSTNGSGHLGAGDHWLGTATSVSTYFRLWDTNGTPLRGDDNLVTSSGSLFADEYQADQTSLMPGSNGFSDGTEPTNPTNCAAGAITNPGIGGYYHNRWWQLASGLGAGEYRLQVTTTDPSNPNRNWDETFENMWSILVQGSGDPRIYGSGRMVSYANVEAGQQTFYLAQIDRQQGAGKTVEIRLFDPGDVGQKAWMQILSPDGNSYDPVTFSYTADNGRSGSNVTCIQTYGGSGPSAPAGCPNETSGGTFYQNSWITIHVPLDASYGSSGLTPPGEVDEGWWKIRYTVNSGNDTTTWEVTIRGNPVRLVVP